MCNVDFCWLLISGLRLGDKTADFMGALKITEVARQRVAGEHNFRNYGCSKTTIFSTREEKKKEVITLFLINNVFV